MKKSVVMFNMLTGNTMTEREGAAFLDIYDLVEAYNGAPGSAVESFDVLSHIEADELTPIPEDMPTAIVESPAAHKTWLDRKLSGIRISPSVKTEAVATAKPEPEKDDYVPPVIQNRNRDHIQGYDWQICVLPRDKNPDRMYVLHFAVMPTQAQLDPHYIKYHQCTHYVHVNEWVRGEWEGITKHYDCRVPEQLLTAADRVVRTAPAPELTGRDVSLPPMSDPWEEADKPFRIRYYSDARKGVAFTYVDKKPTSREMAHFHHTKCLAVSQAKPKEA